MSARQYILLERGRNPKVETMKMQLTGKGKMKQGICARMGLQNGDEYM